MNKEQVEAKTSTAVDERTVNITAAKKLILIATIGHLLAFGIPVPYVGNSLRLSAVVISIVGLLKFFKYSKDHFILKAICILGMFIPVMNIGILLSFNATIKTFLRKQQTIDLKEGKF